MGDRLFTGEEVLSMLDVDGEDGGLEDTFFPGSDEELVVTEDEEDEEDEEVEDEELEKRELARDKDRSGGKHYIY